MDGIIANLAEICDLAERYEAMVMVDDCHAAGFLGKTGRGTPEFCGVQGRVDIITGTLGKALGGASGGYTCSSKQVVELLRQRSRPYLFSNTLAPPIAAGSIKALDLLESSTQLRDRLVENTAFFRGQLENSGLEIRPGIHPIVPVMVGDAVKAQEMARRLLEEGIYVTGFFYPVVPKGTARIRTQVSAVHSQDDLTQAVEAFRKVGRDLGLCR
jgi:glycine C-acetyltransferase